MSKSYREKMLFNQKQTKLNIGNQIEIEKSTNKIDIVEDKFSNLKKIQSAFLHCFYQSNQTDVYFKKLIKLKLEPKINKQVGHLQHKIFE